MIERKTITLADKAVFAAYLGNIDNSTYNFTNMFMWTGNGAITYCEVSGCLVLFFQFAKQPPSASYPIGPGDKNQAICEVCDYLKGQGVRPAFRNLSEWMKDELEQLFPEKFEFIYDRDNSDYVYETEKLITLSGKKLHAKRNHWNFFKNTYDFSYRRLTDDDMPECRRLFDRWIKDKQELAGVENSRRATYAVIDNFSSLGVTGGGIWIGGELVAASFAEPVSDNTVLAHLEFGDQSVRGVFNAINQQFCEHEWAAYRYINREEDMGLSGLRKAKLAYRPVYLIDKYTAALKGDKL